MRYVITYGGCSILWCSKLQMEITLSTTEAEYITGKGYAQSNTFYGNDEGTILYFRYSSFKPRSL